MKLKTCWMLLALSAFLASCSPTEADYDALEWKDDVYLLDGSPFTGIAKATYDDGTAKGEYPFRDGRFHGVVQEWWDNGQRSTETHFESGQRHGSNRYWDRDGKLIKEQVYDHDHSVSEKHY